MSKNEIHANGNVSSFNVTNKSIRVDKLPIKAAQDLATFEKIEDLIADFIEGLKQVNQIEPVGEVPANMEIVKIDGPLEEKEEGCSCGGSCGCNHNHEEADEEFSDDPSEAEHAKFFHEEKAPDVESDVEAEMIKHDEPEEKAGSGRLITLKDLEELTKDLPKRESMIIKAMYKTASESPKAQAVREFHESLKIALGQGSKNPPCSHCGVKDMGTHDCCHCHESVCPECAESNNCPKIKNSSVLNAMLKKYATRAWWENEAGEPMYSPEAIRAEERADSETEPEYDEPTYRSHDRDSSYVSYVEGLQDKLENLIEEYLGNSPDWYPPIPNEDFRETIYGCAEIAGDMLSRSIINDGGIHAWKGSEGYNHWRDVRATLEQIASNAIELYYKKAREDGRVAPDIRNSSVLNAMLVKYAFKSEEEYTEEEYYGVDRNRDKSKNKSNRKQQDQRKDKGRRDKWQDIDTRYSADENKKEKCTRCDGLKYDPNNSRILCPACKGKGYKLPDKDTKKSSVLTLMLEKYAGQKKALDMMNLDDFDHDEFGENPNARKDELPHDHPKHDLARQITERLLMHGRDGTAIAKPNGIHVKLNREISPIIHKKIDDMTGPERVFFI